MHTPPLLVLALATLPFLPGCQTIPAIPEPVVHHAQLEGQRSGGFEITRVDFVATSTGDGLSYEVYCEVGYRNRSPSAKVFLIYARKTWGETPDQPIAGVPLLPHADGEEHVARSPRFLHWNRDGPVRAEGLGYKAWLGHSF